MPPKYRVFLAVLLGICSMLTVRGLSVSRARFVRAGFQLSRLLQDRRILDPENTETVSQYYLLENLTVGLVRDSNRAPSGYGPGLAQSWTRESPTRWVFSLRPGLKWSDGSTITPEEVSTHMESFRGGKHRHTTYLKKLSRATVDGNRLILDFQTPADESLIHELTLADTGLLHPRNRESDWSIVSGPFSVESYEIGKRLLLRRNPYYRTEVDYPKTVELVNVSADTDPDSIDPTAYDVLAVPPPIFYEGNQRLIARAEKVLKGYPTGIYYLSFRGKSPLWKDVEARRELASLVEDALTSPPGNDAIRERQFVPEGFAGRLESPPVWRNLPMRRIAGKRLKVHVQPTLARTTPILEALRLRGAKNHIEFDVESSATHSLSEAADVCLSCFAGNQRDAIGSWQFLFSSGTGPLAAFRNEAKPYFDRWVATKDPAQREEVLHRLHEQVLKNVYGIPLFIEPAVILTSSRVDLSNINRFDMRLRFYEIFWK